jgi:hypothetical protein
MLDEAAGREHSAEGRARTTLAAILTRHRELVLAEVAELYGGPEQVPEDPGGCW